jgi:hypothetical protein
MLILWIRKSKKGERNSQPEIGEGSFKKHNEDMKRFRIFHPEIEAINSDDVITADGNILAAVKKVKLTKHIQN